MSLKNRLTNESLKKHFNSNFELANYAIKIAKNLVKNGGDFQLMSFLDEIRRDPNKYTIEELDAMLAKENDQE